MANNDNASNARHTAFKYGLMFLAVKFAGDKAAPDAKWVKHGLLFVIGLAVFELIIAEHLSFSSTSALLNELLRMALRVIAAMSLVQVATNGRLDDEKFIKETAYVIGGYGTWIVGTHGWFNWSFLTTNPTYQHALDTVAMHTTMRAFGHYMAGRDLTDKGYMKNVGIEVAALAAFDLILDQYVH